MLFMISVSGILPLLQNCCTFTMDTFTTFKNCTSACSVSTCNGIIFPLSYWNFYLIKGFSSSSAALEKTSLKLLEANWESNQGRNSRGKNTPQQTVSNPACCCYREQLHYAISSLWENVFYSVFNAAFQRCVQLEYKMNLNKINGKLEVDADSF